MTHDFNSKLSFSLGEREKFDMDVLKGAIHGCVRVDKTDEQMDKQGIDYVATLRKGAKVFIDAKAREKGASRYWKHGEPELALEKWSVCPSSMLTGKVGWTLNEANPVDLILYTFDTSDSRTFYLLPFQHLRMAFVKNCAAWQRKYMIKRQNSQHWQSEAVFVPASIVLQAITATMKGVADNGD